MQTTEEKIKVHRDAQRRYKLSQAGKEAELKYRQTPKYKISAGKSSIKCKEKWGIWNMVNRAIKSGIILRHNCEICGKEQALAHHDDYADPFNIRWFCVKHHSQYHKNLI